jgi:hypothetical protein
MMLASALSGCASTASVTVNSTFPDLVADPRPIHAAVLFNEEFRTYVATPNDKTNITIGNAQVQLLTKAFAGLFQRVDIVSSRDELQPGTELVITPSVREVQVSAPSESYLNVYEVWIKYNLEMTTPDGVAIDNWFLPAYGKTPDSMMLSRSNAIQQASVVALRDAGAKLLLDFYRIPAVYGWLEKREGR